jgi:hypothetical protein
MMTIMNKGMAITMIGEHNDGGWAAFLDDGDVELPPGVDPLDIAQIVISDSNGIFC